MFARHRGYKTYHSAKPTVAARRRNWSFFSFLKRRNKKNSRQRDFWNKSFRNPFLLKKHLPKRTKAPKTKITIGILCLFGIIGLLIFHPYFNINKIEINNSERISANNLNNLINEILNKKRFWFFNNRNYFLINLNKINEEIKKRYALEDLKIQTKLPDTLKITLQEKQAKLLLQNIVPQLNIESKNYYYLIDAEGKIIQELNENEINNASFLILLMLKSQDLKNLQIGGPVVSPATVEFLDFLQQKIPEKTRVNLAFGSLADQEGRVVHLTTTEGWKIIMDRQNDWEKQLQVLIVFLRDKIRDNRKNLRYIDVRYENRSYYQ